MGPDDKGARALREMDDATIGAELADLERFHTRTGKRLSPGQKNRLRILYGERIRRSELEREERKRVILAEQAAQDEADRAAGKNAATLDAG